jgi:hypothetical protein
VQQPDAGRAVGEHRGQLRDREDEDEVEEQLERRDADLVLARHRLGQLRIRTIVPIGTSRTARAIAAAGARRQPFEAA